MEGEKNSQIQTKSFYKNNISTYIKSDNMNLATINVNGEDEEKKNPDNCSEYSCLKCNYFTRFKRDYNKHISTKKHNLATSDNTKCPKCSKIYSSASNLWKHKKICLQESDYEEPPVDNAVKPAQSDMIYELIKQNKELQAFLMDQNNKIMELAKNQTTIINQNNTMNTTNNNQFNLNFFLNEQCKNALNIQEFLDNMQLNVSDIEATGRLGYVNGISRILINKLKELDVYARPLHCTDYKRETIYIKDKDTWQKETQEKPKMKQIVKIVANKNLRQLSAWQEENPDYKDVATPKNDEFVKISLSSLGSCNKEDVEKDTNKILRNVLKEVVVEKNLLTN